MLAESNGNSLPIAHLTGLESDKTLHEIERHTVDFDRKHTGHAAAARANERYQRRAAA